MADPRFYDVDTLGLTPEHGDTIRVGCHECSWRSEPFEVLNDGPNAAWRAFQSIDHMYREHLLDAHPRKPLRLVAIEDAPKPCGRSTDV